MKLLLYHGRNSIPELEGLSKPLAKDAWAYSWRKSFKHWQAYVGPIVAGLFAGGGGLIFHFLGFEWFVLGAALGGYIGGVIANQIVIPVQRPYMRQFLDCKADESDPAADVDRSEQGGCGQAVTRSESK